MAFVDLRKVVGDHYNIKNDIHVLFVRPVEILFFSINSEFFSLDWLFPSKMTGIPLFFLHTLLIIFPICYFQNPILPLQLNLIPTLLTVFTYTFVLFLSSVAILNK